MAARFPFKWSLAICGCVAALACSGKPVPDILPGGGTKNAAAGTDPEKDVVLQAGLQGLINASKQKLPIAWTVLLNQDALTPQDIPSVLEFVNGHKDYTSYLLLMTLRQYYP